MESKLGMLANVLTLIALACATLFRPRSVDTFVRRVRWVGRRIARRKVLCWVSVGLVTLALRLALLPIQHIPRPAVHDEFSFLLGADTFASGRVTNPRPALWPFFESIHILVTPTYQSKYPPGQSLVMAAGKVIFGNPWFGVWLSCGVMMSALCWMLQGWLPPGWALLGAGLAIFRLGISGYFMNTHWGGAVAATGGCLVIGAYPRITRRNLTGYAWAMGVGLLILASSRPAEGAITVLPIAIALLNWLRTRSWELIARVAVPITVCLAITASLMGYYDYRVTGNVLNMPYMEHTKQYQIAPWFIFLPEHPNKTYRHADLKWQYTQFEMNLIRQVRKSFLSVRGSQLWIFAASTLEFMLTVPLLLTPLVFSDRRFRVVLACLFAGLVAAALSWGFYSRYTAPATGCIFLLVIQCLRHLRVRGFLGRVAANL